MELAVAIAGAAWLGLMATASPCPLATNAAALAFLGRRVGDPRAAVIGGLLFVLAQTLAFAGLAVVLAWGLLSAPVVAATIEQHLNRILGPVLILAGMVLAGLIRPRWSKAFSAERIQRQVGSGWWWAPILGFVLAFAFCPVTAALFFAGLLPLAVKADAPLAIAATFGIAAAAPTTVLALVLSLALHRLGVIAGAIDRWERWAGIVTGTVFILIGIGLALTYVFRVW